MKKNRRAGETQGFNIKELADSLRKCGQTSDERAREIPILGITFRVWVSGTGATKHLYVTTNAPNARVEQIKLPVLHHPDQWLVLVVDEYEHVVNMLIREEPNWLKIRDKYRQISQSVFQNAAS